MGEAGPSDLASHGEPDLSLGQDFGSGPSATLTVLNATNRHLLIDNSLTFGGYHWNDPLEIFAAARYRFRY